MAPAHSLPMPVPKPSPVSLHVIRAPRLVNKLSGPVVKHFGDAECGTNKSRIHCHVQDSGAILCFPPPGVLEDGLSSNGVPRSAAPGGISNPEKMSCGTQCPNPQSLSSGSLTQKQNGLRTTEAKRDAKRMSAKEVTINVIDSIRQADRSRRITKNCVN
ncbi:brain and acute leukemia cytoplasmic protein [Pteropus alecto]|uniref:brain and acute leukemia cytoplasmic protein n=1 Tax=Pteropus alecto TaxID=9402 RepID=UPI000768927E|nr:brain and acute leukemia cytoplasmic protein [Pteropus alecto]